MPVPVIDILKRLQRLERVVLAWIAISSGEAEKRGTAEELNATGELLGQELKAIHEDYARENA